MWQVLYCFFSLCIWKEKILQGHILWGVTLHLLRNQAVFRFNRCGMSPPDISTADQQLKMERQWKQWVNLVAAYFPTFSTTADDADDDSAAEIKVSRTLGGLSKEHQREWESILEPVSIGVLLSSITTLHYNNYTRVTRERERDHDFHLTLPGGWRQGEAWQAKQGNRAGGKGHRKENKGTRGMQLCYQCPGCSRLQGTEWKGLLQQAPRRCCWWMPRGMVSTAGMLHQPNTHTHTHTHTHTSTTSPPTSLILTAIVSQQFTSSWLPPPTPSHTPDLTAAPSQLEPHTLSPTITSHPHHPLNHNHSSTPSSSHLTRFQVSHRTSLYKTNWFNVT